MLAAVLLRRSIVTYTEVDPEIARHLRDILAVEYASPLLSDTAEGLHERDAGAFEDAAERMLTWHTTFAERITFPSLTSKVNGSRILVRAEIFVDGHPPPVGKSTRYFQFHHSMLSGYTYDAEVAALNYHLPFLD